jgi:soluble lytic murein transglycosylase-like protein
MLAAGFAIACVAPVKAGTTPTVPEASAMYRRWVEQAVAEEWGVEGSPARLAAQIHQESSWNPKARSAVGAEGLAQFMPSTAKWIADEFPETLGAFDPWDPQQAALAAAVYDAWLARRNPGRAECDTWSFALSAYNGGEKQLHKEQALAATRGKAADVWLGNVAAARTRSLPAWRENRAYVSRILLVLEPLYLDAGWSGKRGCPP